MGARLSHDFRKSFDEDGEVIATAVAISSLYLLQRQIAKAHQLHCRRSIQLRMIVKSRLEEEDKLPAHQKKKHRHEELERRLLLQP